MSEGSSCRNSSGCRSNISNHYYFDMVLAKDPLHSSVLHQCWDILLQIGGHQDDLSIPVMMWVWCVRTNLGWVYEFFSAEFNFTVSFFDFYSYINAYHWKSNFWEVIQVYGVLNFTVWCNVIFLLWHSWGGVVNGMLCAWAFEGGPTSASPTLQCGSWTIHQECLYQGVLL